MYTYFGEGIGTLKNVTTVTMTILCFYNPEIIIDEKIKLCSCARKITIWDY